jgi:hypothetical protein
VPRTTREEKTMWAHCPPLPDEPICPGYTPEEVVGIKVTDAFTYHERGATDMPPETVENTRDTLLFADELDSPCPSCGRPRILSEARRPTYPAAPGVIRDTASAPAGPVGEVDIEALVAAKVAEALEKAAA